MLKKGIFCIFLVFIDLSVSQLDTNENSITNIQESPENLNTIELDDTLGENTQSWLKTLPIHVLKELLNQKEEAASNEGESNEVEDEPDENIENAIKGLEQIYESIEQYIGQVLGKLKLKMLLLTNQVLSKLLETESGYHELLKYLKIFVEKNKPNCMESFNACNTSIVSMLSYWITCEQNRIESINESLNMREVNRTLENFEISLRKHQLQILDGLKYAEKKPKSVRSILMPILLDKKYDELKIMEDKFQNQLQEKTDKFVKYVETTPKCKLSSEHQQYVIDQKSKFMNCIGRSESLLGLIKDMIPSDEWQRLTDVLGFDV